MTTQTPTAHDRINAAHDRLLAALRAAEDDGPDVIDALNRRRVDVVGSALARLVGRLMAAAATTEPPYNLPLTPDRIAEMVEDTVAEGEQEAKRIADRAAAWKHALPPINFAQAVLRRVEPGPRCGAQGPTVLFAADVTCPACLADMASDKEMTR